VCYSRPKVYVYLRNFVSVGLFCRPVAAKTSQLIFAVFWTSAFGDVANWHQSQKVEHRCITANLPLPNGIKIVSVLQRLHAEIGRTVSDVQSMTNTQTNKQTNKKTQRFWLPRRRVKSEFHQTWYGDRGPRARSCTSKTFGGLTQFRR